MKKPIFFLSIILNIILLAFIGLYLFTPWLDYAVIQTSGPRMCEKIAEDMPELEAPICELLESDAMVSDWDIIEEGVEALKSIQTAEEEAEILETLWSTSYENYDIDLMVSAIDTNGDQTIINLSEAVEPVTVTITFSEGFKRESIEFTPLDLDNVYILLRE